MEQSPKQEILTDPITPEEYTGLIAERKQLDIQLRAAQADPTLPEDVISGIEERLADVMKYIEQFERKNPDKIITENHPDPIQQEIPLLPKQDEMDPERFDDGDRPPAYQRRS